MKHLWFLVFMSVVSCNPVPALAATAPSCPKINESVKDVDGMSFCPDLVKQSSAWVVFTCALNQARAWHYPTKGQQGSVQQLLKAWKANRVAIKKENTASLLAAADNLDLQVCRVKDGDDSYVLLYTKDGVKDYSGGLMMLRESKASKFFIVGPHDDSDGTFHSTKKAFQQSHALALISNGHKRGNIPSGSSGGSRDGKGDFVHERDNLATDTVFMLTNMFNGDGEMGTIMLHIHGMKDSTHVLYRDRDNKVLSNAYEAAVVKSTNIKADAFKALNADFSIDGVKGAMLKTEIPARLHQNGDMTALARIVSDMEKHSFAWSDK